MNPRRKKRAIKRNKPLRYYNAGACPAAAAPRYAIATQSPEPRGPGLFIVVRPLHHAVVHVLHASTDAPASTRARLPAPEHFSGTSRLQSYAIWGQG